MGWQSYHMVVRAGTPDEAFHQAKNQVDMMDIPEDGSPSGTVAEQHDYVLVTLPPVSDLTDPEREKIVYGETYARCQAFERRDASAPRSRARSTYRSWIADLGDGTMVVFGWAYAG